jgi:hypothetical protein
MKRHERQAMAFVNSVPAFLTTVPVFTTPRFLGK